MPYDPPTAPECLSSNGLWGWRNCHPGTMATRPAFRRSEIALALVAAVAVGFPAAWIVDRFSHSNAPLLIDTPGGGADIIERPVFRRPVPPSTEHLPVLVLFA
jgi:hypothetical protein